jgi:DNA (cytosine-5)-methyltransferase 1
MGASHGGGFDASEDGTGRGTPLVRATPDTNGVRAASGLPGRVDDPRPDGPRYAAMGNAVTVNVLEWIGHRIMSYEDGANA